MAINQRMVIKFHSPIVYRAMLLADLDDERFLDDNREKDVLLLEVSDLRLIDDDGGAFEV